MKPSSAWLARHTPCNASVTAGMNAVPATAFGDAGSWQRSSQADSADGDGTTCSRWRRQREVSERRSLRDSKSRSMACSTAANPLSPLQPLQVLDTVAAGKVQENHRQHHLKVQPALPAGDLDVLADRRRPPAAVNQVQIQRQTRQRGHPGAWTRAYPVVTHTHYI